MSTVSVATPYGWSIVLDGDVYEGAKSLSDRGANRHHIWEFLVEAGVKIRDGRKTPASTAVTAIMHPDSVAHWS